MHPHTAWSGSMLARRFPEPRLRYVGNYNADFPGGGTTLTVNVPVTDLQFAPSPFRQVIVVVALETQILTSVTIDGIAGPLNKTEDSRFTFITGAFNARDSGSIPIDILAKVALSDDSDILIFEAEYCRPIAEAFNCYRSVLVASTWSWALDIPDRGVALFGAFNATDSGSFTITATGFTEVVDADFGDNRMAGAICATPAAGTQHVAGTVIVSAGTPRMVAIALAPLDNRDVRGGPQDPLLLLLSADPLQVPDLDDYYVRTVGLGKAKFVAAIMGQTGETPTGITWGGVALTFLGVITQSDQAMISLWELDFDEATFAGGEILVDMTAAPSQPLVMRRYFLYGAQSSVIQTEAQAAATGNAVAVNTVKGSVILAFHVRNSNSQTVTWTGVAEMTDVIANSEYGIMIGTRWACDAETGRTVQPVGSGSGAYSTLIATFHP